jgi:serine/threonine protein kinase
MSLSLMLSAVALKQAAQGAMRLARESGGERAVGAVAAVLVRHFVDQSQRLTQALARANDRTWRAVELALAGNDWWESTKRRLSRAEDRALAEQIRRYLDQARASAELAALDERTCRAACDELRQARAAGYLHLRDLAPDQLARQTAQFARFDNPLALLRAEAKLIGQIAELLAHAGYPHLARVLQPPADAESLLARAMRYYFRRAVEDDPALARGLNFAQLEQLRTEQEAGFAALEEALATQGQRLEQMLAEVGEAVVRVQEAVLDVAQEQRRQGEQAQAIYEAVLHMQKRLDLLHQRVRPGDSLSIRSEDERQLVRQTIARYRAMPESARRSRPALLNAVGQLELAAGDFEAAQRDFAALASLVQDQQAKALAHLNAYHAALAARQWDHALGELQQALAYDPRLAPLPLSKYRPRRIIGAGGFGTVFLCEHSYLNAEVVVKVLHADQLGTEVGRIFAEAQILRRLDHPAIIRIHDCDYVEPARREGPFLVMDYFPGLSLHEYIQQHGPLSVADWSAIAELLLAGLAAAHAAGVLHRDIKPANVLVRQLQHQQQQHQHQQWQVKLIDFGLAVPALTTPTASTSRRNAAATVAGVAGWSLAGTPDYAAPEQLGRLASTPTTVRSDLYGFARTACYALFATPNPTFKHWRSIPEPLADLLGRCLSEAVEERPASASAVLAELTASQSSLPQARPVVASATIPPLAESALPVASRESSPPRVLRVQPKARPASPLTPTARPAATPTPAAAPEPPASATPRSLAGARASPIDQITPRGCLWTVFRLGCLMIVFVFLLPGLGVMLYLAVRLLR